MHTEINAVILCPFSSQRGCFLEYNCEALSADNESDEGFSAFCNICERKKLYFNGLQGTIKSLSKFWRRNESAQQ